MQNSLFYFTLSGIVPYVGRSSDAITDITLADDSPANAVGFKPIDTSLIGLRPQSTLQMQADDERVQSIKTPVLRGSKSRSSPNLSPEPFSIMKSALYFSILTCLTLIGSLRAETTDRPLRVVAYNIKHGCGMDGVVNLERIAKVIAAQRPDLVALQEVDKNCGRSGNRDIAQELGKRLGMQHRFGKAIKLQGGEYGNAVLSSLPILEAKTHLLPKSGEQRAALEVVVRHNGRPLSFVSLHLERNSGAERNAQTRALDQLFRDRKHPVILAGDFNAARWSAPMKLLAKSGWAVLEKNDGNDIRTIHGEKNRDDSDTPERVEIDYLVTRGLSSSRFAHGVIPELMASDHRPIYAVFEPGSGTPTPIQAVIPRPMEMDLLDGAPFAFTPSTRIVYQDDILRETADYLRDRIAGNSGSSLKVETGEPQAKNAVRLAIDSSLKETLGNEGYRLRVGDESVVIEAADRQGVFYGIQTLFQLLPPDCSRKGTSLAKWALPRVAISDKPRFPWRAYMLDSCRHFQSPEFIKRYLDLLAFYKFNVFHGHLVDADPVLKKDAKPWVEDSRIAANTTSLASTGKSFTGATIVMNIVLARAIGLVPVDGQAAKNRATSPRHRACPGGRTGIRKTVAAHF